MKRILFNDVHKQFKYTKNFEFLFSDYDLFRKKHFSELCLNHLNKHFPNSDLLLTHSATGALEIIAQLINTMPGDEIIMPSFTFVSTANAFVNKGAIPVFIDIDPLTLNIDIAQIESAITTKTKAIICMHYSGNACDLISLKQLCQKHKIFLIEDAATGYGSYYKGEALGSIGDFGVISFDITKHITAIQGGLLIINKKTYTDRARKIYHIGTNRIEFEQGAVPAYTWVDHGSKYQMNELNAAVLYEDLCHETEIFEQRKKISAYYWNALNAMANKFNFTIMAEPIMATNIHAFYLILKDEVELEKFSKHLSRNNIEVLTHYTPLHRSQMGIKIGRDNGCTLTESIASRLIRLPMHANLSKEDLSYICQQIKAFWHE